MREIEFIKVQKMYSYMEGQKYIYRIFGGDGEERKIRIHDWATLLPVDEIYCGPAGDRNIYQMVWDAVVRHLKNLTAISGFSEFEVFNPENNKWVKFKK